jgi:DTW domain-containing protein YfiP
MALPPHGYQAISSRLYCHLNEHQRLRTTRMAQFTVAALVKGWATIACEPCLDLSHSCSPECRDTYDLVITSWVIL